VCVGDSDGVKVGSGTGEEDSVAVAGGVKVGVVIGIGDGNGVGDGVGVVGRGVDDVMSTSVVVGIGVGSESELLAGDVLVTSGVAIFFAVTSSLTAVGGLRALSFRLSPMARYTRIAYVVTATAPKPSNIARSVDVKNSTSLPGKYRRPETQTQSSIPYNPINTQNLELSNGISFGAGHSNKGNLFKLEATALRCAFVEIVL